MTGAGVAGRGVGGAGVGGAGVGGRGVGAGVGAAVGVAACAVRSTWIIAPCRHVAVWVARVPPTEKLIVAPSVPQPVRDAADATSTTNVPVALTVVTPPAGATVQSTVPIVATIAVPAAAGRPLSCADP